MGESATRSFIYDLVIDLLFTIHRPIVFPNLTNTSVNVTVIMNYDDKQKKNKKKFRALFYNVPTS